MGNPLFRVDKLVKLLRGESSPDLAGNGKVEPEPREVSAFHIVRVHGAIDLQIKPGPVQSVTIHAETNILPFIETKVKNGTLHLDTNATFQTRSRIVAVVEVAELREISTSGSGDIALSTLDQDTIVAITSGSGDIIIHGTVFVARLTSYGSGDINASSLSAKILQAETSCSGDIVAAASQQAEVRSFGSGNITVLGKPPVFNAKSHGSGDITVKT